MNSALDKEYLSRPLIANVTYVITDDLIKIDSPNTSWINRQKYQKTTQAAILEEYKELLNICRQYHIKVSYTNGYKRFILDHWTEYTKAVEVLNSLFEQAKKQAEKVKNRGIHVGCTDDSVLEDLIAISSKMHTFYYGTSIISKMETVFSAIRRHILTLPMEAKGQGVHDMQIYL